MVDLLRRRNTLFCAVEGMRTKMNSNVERQQIDALDLLIQTPMDNEKKMDKLLSELEVLIGYLNGSISRKEQRW